VDTPKRIVVEVGGLESLVELGDQFALLVFEFEAGVRFGDFEEAHPFGEVPRQPDVRILIRTDGDHGWLGLLELRVEDVGHLGDDRLHVRDIGLAVEAIDRLELREIGLRAEIEGEVLHLAVSRLTVEFPSSGSKPSASSESR